MAVTSFRHWKAEDLARATVALVDMAAGFISQDEEEVLALLAQAGLEDTVALFREKLEESIQDRQFLEKMLYEAFIAGWACRGATEAILHDEVPEPGLPGRRK